jgi:hypothetical protein
MRGMLQIARQQAERVLHQGHGKLQRGDCTSRAARQVKDQRFDMMRRVIGKNWVVWRGMSRGYSYRPADSPA